MEDTSFQKIKDSWETVLTYLKNEFDIIEISYTYWIEPLKPDHMEKDENGKAVLCILVPDEDDLPGSVFQNFVSKKYGTYLSVAVDAVTGIKCRMKFVTKKENQEKSIINRVPKKVDPASLANANLNPDRKSVV